ncbi:MAG: Hint domain-containing protein [Shimia sp.]
MNQRPRHADLAPQVPTVLGTPPRPRPKMRKYEVAYLGPNGDAQAVTRVAPASTMFEGAFMAIARGSLIATPAGPVAVEDLRPGDTIDTIEHGPQTLRWTGATTLVPGAPGQNPGSASLTRVSPDAFGFGRPAADLLLGVGARVYRNGSSGPGRLVHAEELIDGEAVLHVTPPGPVRVFHLVVARHGRVSANGLEVESYHPGARAAMTLGPEMRSVFLSLFPHLRSFEEFGPVTPARALTERRGEIF